jgi:hypothetical protein
MWAKKFEIKTDFIFEAFHKPEKHTKSGGTSAREGAFFTVDYLYISLENLVSRQLSSVG